MASLLPKDSLPLPAATAADLETPCVPAKAILECRPKSLTLYCLLEYSLEMAAR